MKLATQVGRPYDTRAVEQDVRYLWSLGRFEDIRVEFAEGAVVFRATPRSLFTIRQVRLEPNTFELEIPKLEGERIGRERADQAAADARKQLQDRGFFNARVTYELAPRAPRLDRSDTEDRSRRSGSRP